MVRRSRQARAQHHEADDRRIAERPPLQPAAREPGDRPYEHQDCGEQGAARPVDPERRDEDGCGRDPTESSPPCAGRRQADGQRRGQHEERRGSVDLGREHRPALRAQQEPERLEGIGLTEGGAREGVEAERGGARGARDRHPDEPRRERAVTRTAEKRRQDERGALDPERRHVDEPKSGVARGRFVVPEVVVVSAHEELDEAIKERPGAIVPDLHEVVVHHARRHLPRR